MFKGFWMELPIVTLTPDKKDLADIRLALRKAADIKDPRDMWYTVRDILNLLTMLVVPAEKIHMVTAETLPG